MTSTSPSITSRLTKPILSLIFSLVDSPAELAVSCTMFNGIGRNDLLRASWLRNHGQVLAAWAAQAAKTRASDGNLGPGTSTSTSPIAASPAISTTANVFPARLLTEPVVALLLDTLSAKPQDATAADLFRALWSLAAKNRYPDVMYGVVAEGSLSRPASICSPRSRSVSAPKQQQQHPATLQATVAPTMSSVFLKLFDNLAWKETLFAAVRASIVSPRFLDTVLLRYPQSVSAYIVEYFPEGAFLAASTGQLRALTLFADIPAGAKVIQERGLDMLRAAASNGHRDLVLYLVGRGGFSEHHDALVKTYRGLHVLLEASEKGLMESGFNNVMEGWKQSSEEDQFQMRWRMAFEVACERNYSELVKKLLESRTEKQLTDGELKIKLRMFALAIQNGHDQMGSTLLELAAREDKDASLATIDAGKINMLAGIGSFASINQRNALLLKRYCHITDHDLAPQIGLTATDIHNDWKQNVAAHRVAVVKYFCNSDPTFLPSLNKNELKDDLWSAFKLGHYDAAKYLKEASGIQVEWMDTASSWSLTEVANNNLTVSATDSIPPALAMALFETLGGTWCVGAGDSRGPVVTSKDIGALLVAAEASKDSTLGRLKVSDYDAASRQISRDESFLTALHPRMIINPEDKMWTKFLDGKLDAADKNSEEGFSWMEPKQNKEDAAAAQVLGADGEIINNPVNLWRDQMGLKQDRENEELSFFLGLGGRLPETAALTVEQSMRENELARQYHAEY
ncbi:UNVERIFIED_CONTAM: hypothetical protein HDU68_007568 [Siphonaria sp. JEL0065]|nr:hypothetical protein HDU68_007568 [Siphonaria sp. JEL0065]